MKFTYAALVAATVFAGPALAGDAANGEKIFKKCKSCHTIKNGDDVIFKGGKTGPNLYGVAGRTAGTAEGFKYGKSIVEAGEKGLVWDEESFSNFVQNPKGFLGDYLDDGGAKSKMSFKLKKGMEDVYAYLESVAK